MSEDNKLFDASEIVWTATGQDVTKKHPAEGDLVYEIVQNRFLTYQYVSENWTLVAATTLDTVVADGDTITFPPVTLRLA